MHALLVLAIFASSAWSSAGRQLVGHRPTLLFTDQRIKRLKRDRERQTERWTNFEARVKNVQDSPERGFELALYYAITGDESTGAKLDPWRMAHPCERRQSALIADTLARGTNGMPSATDACPQNQARPLANMRDFVFEHASGETFSLDKERFLSLLRSTPLNNSSELYAATEILAVLERDERAAIRQQAPQFFNSLPVQFLLSLKPAQVDHPEWMAHVAALSLIALDPNSDSSQFLQGWAIEDRQMIQEGPGVAYELLWADSYLPGVGYQNLDPWWYDEKEARLLARTDWSAKACSIQISSAGVKAEQCPDGWQARSIDFGKLQLTPLTERCIEVNARLPTASAILWKLPPNGHLKITESGKSVMIQADRAGMWRVPSNIVGKVCSVR